MDVASGKMLNDFTGHKNESYRCRACFGHAEASVVCGDENGQVWAWDLLDVSSSLARFVWNSHSPLGKTIGAESSSKNSRQGDNMG